MHYRSNSILSLIPQNKEGEHILKQSIFFQKILDMRMFVMDVIKSSSPFQNRLVSKRQIDKQQKEVDKLYSFVKSVIKKEIPKEIILRIKYGNTVSTLINESKKGGYEFIVIDKSGGNFEGALTKIQTNKFISKSHCPVLTINKDLPVKEINKIVIPIDISQTTKKRLYWATLFAKKFDAEIQIVSALNVNIDETKSLALKNAEKIKKMLNERDVKCDIKVLKAHQKEKHQVILNHIKEEHPDLVIIRTHQEFIFSGKKIGKFVSEVVHGCKMPVFTVGGPTQRQLIDFK